MGLFDKWKPKGAFSNEQVKGEMQQMGNNALNYMDGEYNESINGQSAAGLEREGYDLAGAEAVSGTDGNGGEGAVNGKAQPRMAENGGAVNGKYEYYNPNGRTKDKNGQISVNPQMLGVKPDALPNMLEGKGKVEVPEGTIATPKTNIDELEGADLLAGLAPMSEEEQLRNARRAEAVSGIAHFGNALAALGNVFAVGAGADSQTNPQLPNVDAEGYLERGRQQRMQYAQMKNAMQMNEKQMQLRQQEQERRDAMLKIQQDKAERQANIEEKMLPYKIALQQGKIDIETYKKEKAKAEAEIMGIKAEYAPKQQEADLGVKKARQTASYASASNSYAGAQQKRMRADKDNVYFYSDEEGEISVSASRMSDANVAKIHKLTGEDATVDGEKPKTKTQMLDDIGRHIDDMPEVREAVKRVKSGSRQRTASRNSGNGGGRNASGTGGNSGRGSRGGRTYTKEENLEAAKAAGF